MSENGEIYTASKNFTLPPALTALTNSTSVSENNLHLAIFSKVFLLTLLKPLFALDIVFL